MVEDKLEVGNILCFASGKKECEIIAKNIISTYSNKDNNTIVCIELLNLNQKVLKDYEVYEQIRN